jgi:hypothetical protein
MSKLDQIRGTFNRVHSDLFDAAYEAEFINTSRGTRDNATDSFTGETETSIGTIPVEIVPPAMDTTVRETGTSFSWDTSIRFPENNGTKTVSQDETIQSGTTQVFDIVTVESGATLTVEGTLVTDTLTVNGTLTNNGTVTVLDSDFAAELNPLGEDNQQPTEVVITDPSDDGVDEYELHGYSYEKGSGMLMCRLVEK